MPPATRARKTRVAAAANANDKSPRQSAVAPPQSSTAEVDDEKELEEEIEREELEVEEEWEEALEEQLEGPPTKKLKLEVEIKLEPKRKRQTTYKTNARTTRAAGSKAKAEANINITPAKVKTDAECDHDYALNHPRPSTRWLMKLSNEYDLMDSGAMSMDDTAIARRWPEPFLPILDIILRKYEHESAAAQEITYEIKWYASVRRAVKKVAVDIGKLDAHFGQPCIEGEESAVLFDYIERVLDDAGVDKESAGAMELADKWSTW